MLSAINLNVTTANENDVSSDPHTISSASVILSVATVLMSAFITFVNLLTIVVIRRTPSLRTLSNMYVTSLALSDLVVGLSLIPLSLFYIPPTRTRLFDQNIRFCVLVFGVSMGVVVVSNINMTLIAADRYIYITRPYSYKRVVKKKGVFTLLACAWGFGVVYAILPQVTHNASEVCDSTLVFPVWYLFHTNLSLYSLLVVVDLVLYSHILRVAYKQRRTIGATLTLQTTSSTAPGNTSQDCQAQTTTSLSAGHPNKPLDSAPRLDMPHALTQNSFPKEDMFSVHHHANGRSKVDEITGAREANTKNVQEEKTHRSIAARTILPCCNGGTEARSDTPTSQKSKEKSPTRNGSSRMKSVKFFMTVFGVYFVCLTPTIVCMPLDYYLTVPKFLYNTFVLLALLNSGVNFVIYMALNARFKLSVLRFLGLSKASFNDMTDLTNFDA